MGAIAEDLHISKALALLDLPDEHEFDEVISLSYRDHLGLEPPEPTTTGDQFVFPDGPHDYEIFEAAVDYTIKCLNQADKSWSTAKPVSHEVPESASLPSLYDRVSMLSMRVQKSKNPD